MFYDLNDLIVKKDAIKKIFFYRICGTGMGTLAVLLKDLGKEIAGYDLNYLSPMKEVLEKNKIRCYQNDFDFNIIKEFDLVVVGNTVSKNSDEVINLQNINIPQASFSAVLGGMILEGKQVVGIAGTHGKTTTTYFASQIFKKLGEDVGYFIGGVIDGIPSGYLGKSKYFFIESDEYDSAYFEKFSKFHNYRLHDLILTSLEFDHADIFSSLEKIEEEFDRLIKKMPKDGLKIFNTDYPAIIRLRINGKRFDKDSYKIKNSDFAGTRFYLALDNFDSEFITNLVGPQNILNLVAMIYYAYYQGFTLKEIKTTINNLKLLKRRQEYKGKYQGAVFIDDFAHHPTAVDLTIDAIRSSYPKKKMILVFAPASATARSDLFFDEFTTVLKKADDFILIPPSSDTTVKDAKTMDMNKLREKLEKGTVVSNVDDLIFEINRLISSDALFLFMTNGPCLGFWSTDFSKNIK